MTDQTGLYATLPEGALAEIESLADDRIVCVPYSLICQIDGELSAIAHGHGTADLEFCKAASQQLRSYSRFCSDRFNRTETLLSLVRLASQKEAQQ